MSKTKKSSLSVLTKQKVKRRSRYNVSRYLIITVFFVIFFLVVFTIIIKPVLYSVKEFLITKISFSNLFRDSKVNDVDINIYCINNCDGVLNNKLNLDEIKMFTLEYMDSHFNVDISELVKRIYEKFDFEFVHIFKVSSTKFDIGFIPYKPILAIKVGDKIKLVSDKYKVIDLLNGVDFSKFVLISGILDDLYTIEYREDRSIKVPKDSEYILKQAISLYHLLIRNGFKYVRAINYLKYRGFSVKLKQPALEIVFAEDMLESQFKKLSNILSRKNIKNIVKIELDYKDKAFISEL